MSRDDFDSQKAKNANAFQLLYEIEIILRELCAAKLETLHGKKWTKRGLPSDVLDKVKAAISYERKSTWHRAILHHPLYYIDFPDLKKILVSGSNWSSAFSEVFGQKAGTESSLSELELLRNQVAHNRFVSDGDLQVLTGLHAKLMQSIPDRDLTAARESASARTSIVTHLEEVSYCVDAGLLAMTSAAALATKDIPDGALTDAWWFDEAYLSQDTESVRSYSALCDVYSKMPRGVGQALSRRKWIDENDALTVGKTASSTMSALLREAKRLYE